MTPPFRTKHALPLNCNQLSKGKRRLGQQLSTVTLSWCSRWTGWARNLDDLRRLIRD